MTLRAPVGRARALQRAPAARPALVRRGRTVAALDPDNLDVMVAGGGGVGMEVTKRMKVRAGVHCPAAPPEHRRPIP